MVLVYMQNVRNFKALLLRVCPVGMGVVLEVVILVMARTTIVIKYRARCSGICVQPSISDTNAMSLCEFKASHEVY